MIWLIDFCQNLIGVFNELKAFMTSRLDALSDLLGVNVTPLTLVSTFLVTFILSMLVLRVIRG